MYWALPTEPRDELPDHLQQHHSQEHLYQSLESFHGSVMFLLLCFLCNALQCKNFSGILHSLISQQNSRHLKSADCLSDSLCTL